MPTIWEPESNKVENKTVSKRQTFTVAKANELIQQSRSDMTVPQNKLLLYLISKIKPTDTGEEVYTFTYRDFCKVCNVDYDSGKNYQIAKDALKAISDKSVWMDKVENGKMMEVVVRWFGKPKIDKETGIISIKFDEDIFPYLFNLRQRLNYTTYRLENVLTMKSKYGIQLYELLKSYQYLKKDIVFTMEELRYRFNLHKKIKNENGEDEYAEYKRYPDFRRYVIEKAIKDINECSDIQVGYMPIKANGKRATDSIKFTIKEPDEYDLKVRKARKERKLHEETKAAINRRVRAYKKRENNFREE